MILKKLPEDFIVEEIIDLEILSHNAGYKLFCLEKKNIEAFYIIRYISKRCNIPLNAIGIAGLKDKYALTRQYLTIPQKYDIKIKEEKNFTISFIGYVKDKIKIGGMKCNKFEITVRDINKGERESINKNVESLVKFGVPNYFDSQRFGSVISKEFIAKYIIKKDYEKAVKLFLTQYTKSEKSSVKNDKRIILQNWNDLKNNIWNISAKNKLILSILKEYKKTKDWLKAYNAIPSNLREMFVSAYQSYLWNECVKESLKSIVDKKKLYNVKYNIGSILFYKSLSEEESNRLQLPFTTISHNAKPNEFEKKIISKILAKEGLTINEFDIKKETGQFFADYKRDIIINPTGFCVSKIETDEIYDKSRGNRFKMRVSFTLQKGSYATIIIKRIFNK